MNIAILFDSAEEDTKINCPRICGQEIYLYALKAFYMHDDIDGVFYMCRYTDTLLDVFSHISAWREESGIDKPVTVLHGIRHFTQIWLHILQSEQERPENYVIHDVRFPLVTEDLIAKVIHEVGEHGIALCSGGMYNPEYLGYPAAVRSESQVLHYLDEPKHILRELAYCEPYCCENSGENNAVYSIADIERAEKILERVGGTAV